MTDTTRPTDPPLVAWLAALILLFGATTLTTLAMWLGELAPGWVPLTSACLLVIVFVVACVTVAVVDHQSTSPARGEGVGGRAED